MSHIDQAITATCSHDLHPLTDRCKRQGETCKLSTGHEAAFVALCSARVLDRLRQAPGQHGAEFHRWIYLPCQRAETHVGYDLSIGRPAADVAPAADDVEPRRVQAMHKLLLGWCDVATNWRPNSTDRRHIKTLVGNYIAGWHDGGGHALVLPFIVLHTCFCIHEYRRMGRALQHLTVPNVDSLLRTVVIPLSPLAERVRESGLYEPANQPATGYNVVAGVQLGLRYRRVEMDAQPDEGPQAFLDRVSTPLHHRVRFTFQGQNFPDDSEVLSVVDWENLIANHLVPVPAGGA